MKSKASLLFITFALVALLFGILFGLFATVQYIDPDFLKEYVPFSKMRPFHVTSIISWIILCATGSIYFFISKVEKIPFSLPKLPMIHLIVFFLTGIGIYISYITGNMEGREYFAFTPILLAPILIGWVLFGINYFITIRKNIINWPVYYWMWGTGIIFMIYHLCEAHLWLIPSFREHFIKDMSVQWKSYGSFVGSWNMLVYGIGIYIMSKIKKDESVARKKTVFFFYFLGLINLMLGWAHHTYIIPTEPWIRSLSYVVSMTEWIVLVHIIYSWKKSLSLKNKQDNCMAYKFLMAADFWVFLNIILALLVSIPAINFFTHGTHITVAHSMGTTIGINTTILFASVFFIVSKIRNEILTFKNFKISYYLFNVSLLLFLSALFYAGVKRSNWMYFTKDLPFSELQDSLYSTYIVFLIFGVCLVVAISYLATVLLKIVYNTLKA
ncbi:MAG: cbb3-type cytochrome c oxidase subunit I [Maribacter sp.]|nr:cbb3-type cytochrome c oxidase subunit I [Maribacter sp.]